MIVMAALLSFLAAAAPGVDIVANETPIHTVKNAEAVAKIPAGFKFVEPGTLTVAISLPGSGPPFGLYARDNKTVIGSEADSRAPGGRRFGVETQAAGAHLVGRLAVGVASGKYDAAVYKYHRNQRTQDQIRFSPPIVRIRWGSTSNPTARSPRSTPRRISPVKRSSSIPAPTRKRCCWPGQGEPRQ